MCPWENQTQPDRWWYSSNHRFRSHLAQWMRDYDKKLGGPDSPQKCPFDTNLCIFGSVFLQQEKPCKNEIPWIMFYNYQSKGTDVRLNWAIWLISVAASLVSCTFHSVVNGKYLQWAKPNTHYSNMDSESNQKKPWNVWGLQYFFCAG